MVYSNNQIARQTVPVYPRNPNQLQFPIKVAQDDNNSSTSNVNGSNVQVNVHVNDAGRLGGGVTINRKNFGGTFTLDPQKPQEKKPYESQSGYSALCVQRKGEPTFMITNNEGASSPIQYVIDTSKSSPQPNPCKENQSMPVQVDDQGNPIAVVSTSNKAIFIKPMDSTASQTQPAAH